MLKLSKAIAQWQPSETAAGQPPIALLEAGWEEIVGCEVAQNSHPARVADGTLTVTTRSSAWSHQLSFLAEHLLRAVAARLPDAGIEHLRFRVGRLLPRRRGGANRQGFAASRSVSDRPDSASPGEALARFRRDVEQHRDARRGAGVEGVCRVPGPRRTGCGFPLPDLRGRAHRAAHRYDRSADVRSALVGIFRNGRTGLRVTARGVRADPHPVASALVADACAGSRGEAALARWPRADRCECLRAFAKQTSS